MFIIEDGTGSGYKVKVNDKNQLETTALITGIPSVLAHDGEVFFLSTDFIPLTSTGVFSGLWLLSNTTRETYHIDLLRISTDVGVLKVKLIKNPTTGTLFSSGTAGYVQNSNLTSPKTLAMTFLKGADGLTVTDGDHLTQIVVNASADRIDTEASIVLTPSSTLALVVKPSIACEASAAVMIYRDISAHNS